MVAAPAAGFWLNPNFKPFLPYLRSSRDERQGQHARIELDTKTPAEILSSALAWSAPCAACGAPMHPFRARRSPAKRGHVSGAVYVGTTCRQADNAGCSRGQAAADALAALEHALTTPTIEPTQANWLAMVPVTPSPSWH
jgi:hypothetical protein